MTMKEPVVRAVIRIQPTAQLRQEFAVWAVAQTPKVRTVSSVAFAVPVHLFAGIPEELLAGALVEGQPYVPVPRSTAAEPAVEPAAGPAGEEHQRKAEEQEAAAAEPSPPAAGPSPPADPEPSEPGGGRVVGGQGEVPAAAGRRRICGIGGCTRDYANDETLAAHRRKAHHGYREAGE
jgi:hypothetical protein